MDDENLVVGCSRDVDIASGEPLAARVDVVHGNGQWVRTLADTTRCQNSKSRVTCASWAATSSSRTVPATACSD
jgi:hypothetical protein